MLEEDEEENEDGYKNVNEDEDKDDGKDEEVGETDDADDGFEEGYPLHPRPDVDSRQSRAAETFGRMDKAPRGWHRL